MSMRRNQDGSATIEASIALTAFIFVIVAIYLLVNFCIVQAKVSYAIDTTAKEMSQYSYFYHVLNLDSAKQGLGDNAQEAVNAFEDLASMLNGDKDADLGAVKSDIESAVNNPKAFMTSLASMAAGDLWDAAQSNLVAAPLAKSMTRRHFGSDDASANQYLESKGVVGGYDGLDFSKSKIFEGTSEKIEVVVTYTLNIHEVIPLLDQQIVLTQKAVTDGWLGGDAA